MSKRTVVSLHSRTQLASFLQRDPMLHLYALADLGTFFWERTTWYALKSDRGILEVVLIYRSRGMPTVLAFKSGPDDAMVELLRQLVPVLPRAFHFQATPEVRQAIAGHWDLTPQGEFVRMGLTDRDAHEAVDTARSRPVLGVHHEELVALYDTAHPGHAFDQRMLYTELYQGLWVQGKVVSVAGVHTWSPKYNAAALGNIATHPDHRGRGLGTIAVAAVLKRLTDCDAIGLNVDSRNTTALGMYERLGFAEAMRFEAWIAGPK